MTGQLGRLLSRGTRRWSIAALLAAAFASSWPGIVQYLSTGQVDMHWSRAMLSSLLVVVAVVLGITSFLIHMLELVAAQQHDPRALRPPDRIRPARSAPRAPHRRASGGGRRVASRWAPPALGLALATLLVALAGLELFSCAALRASEGRWLGLDDLAAARAASGAGERGAAPAAAPRAAGPRAKGACCTPISAT